jgi:hypothetical protein
MAQKNNKSVDAIDEDLKLSGTENKTEASKYLQSFNINQSMLRHTTQKNHLTKCRQDNFF